jgi:hypothetical protein
VSAETAILSQLLRGMARRSVYWRRQRNQALARRNQALRDTRAALAAIGNALGLRVVAHPSDLRRAALELRANLLERDEMLRQCHGAIAALLGDSGDGPAARREAELLEIGVEDLSHEELRGLVAELRKALDTCRELNRGWARYGERVREERRAQVQLRRELRELQVAHDAGAFGVSPELSRHLSAKLSDLAQRPGELSGRAQDLLDVADALLGRPDADGSPYNRWLEPTRDGVSEP